MSTLIGSVRESPSNGLLPAPSHHRRYLKSAYAEHQKIHKDHFNVFRLERRQGAQVIWCDRDFQSHRVWANQSSLSPTSRTRQIKLEDDLEPLASPWGPLPLRPARQDRGPREQVVRRQHGQRLLTVFPRKAPPEDALHGPQAQAAFRAYRLCPDEQEQVEFERVEWQVV
jgi:hypothetical protein